MNDFLSSLAARALRTLPVVTPRPVSRFEPDGRASLSEQVAESVSRSPTPASVKESTPSPTQQIPAENAESVPTPQWPNSDRAHPSVAREAEKSGAHSRPIQAVDEPAGVHKDADSRAATSAKKDSHRRLESLRPQLPDTSRPLRAQPAGNPWPQPADAAPTIHVSIGRVEVRAIHRGDKTAVPRPATAEPARLSLGSYLRGRRD